MGKREVYFFKEFYFEVFIWLYVMDNNIITYLFLVFELNCVLIIFKYLFNNIIIMQLDFVFYIIILVFKVNVGRQIENIYVFIVRVCF